MTLLRQTTRAGRAAVGFLAAAAVVAASAGLVALTPAPDTSWASTRPADVTPVPAIPWDQVMPGPTSSYPLLTTAEASAMHNIVPSSTAGTGNTKPVVHPAVFSMTGQVASNDKGAGDFAAIPGASAGDWGVAGQSGSFTWNYPFALRKAPGGATPSLALAYDSSTVDGLTSSTNNQASVIGDGWALAGGGSIRQNFAPCMDQGVESSYDLCGLAGGQVFTISFGGQSGKVIMDAATGAYKLQNDDNTKIEYLKTSGSNGTFDGGYWKLTDTSGTQYFFGRNHLPGWVSGNPTTNSADTVPVGAANSTQLCAAATFADSLCMQAYAWNLDYVVDTNGNSQAYYYTQDKNNYASQAGTGPLKNYVRASRLARVDYGMRSGTELSATAPLRAALTYTARCTGVTCTSGTDVPTTYDCAATGTCDVYSPTFFTTQRLQTLTTQTLVGTAFQNADVWTLAHTMPNPGDGLSPALWLYSVTHQGANTLTGVGGAITDPAVVFAGQPLQNRVWVLDGLAQLNRYRLNSIKTVTGAVISVTYKAPECTPTNLPTSPETNNKRCYPAWWAPTTPIPQAPRMDYFNIYPVASVATSSGPGATGSSDMVTTYNYVGYPAWKYAGPKYVAGTGGSQLTWSVLAGWSQVTTTVGNAAAGANPTRTVTYLRGLDGTPSDTVGGKNAITVEASNGSAVTDSPWLAGAQIETQTFLGEKGAQLTSTVTIPWSSAPTATGTAGTGADQARHTGTKSVTKYVTSGQSVGTRISSSTNYFDARGRVIAVSDAPESGSSGTGKCTLTTFADNTTTNLLAFPATATSRTGQCVTDGTSTGAILRASRTLYDGSTSAEPGTTGYITPTKGNPTRADSATAVSGTTVTTWLQGPATAYDALGRPTTSTDTTTGTARTTTTAYTPATGLATSTKVTNPLGWVTTENYDTVRGNVLTSVDENTNTTSYRYDASGRTTGVWDPMRPVATNPVPTQATTYKIQQTAPSWILTGTVNNLGTVTAGYQIYDGLGRLRQTQNMSPGGGTIATDTFYNSAGATSLVSNDYYLSTEPSGTLMIPTLAVPSSDRYDYDGAGRLAKDTTLANDNQTLWTTSLTYAGADTTTMTGPGAESASTVVVNNDGNTIARLLYHGTTVSGTPDTTSYVFDSLGQNTSMKDTAGNSWTWVFDPAGREVSALDPDTGTTTTSYDASGRLSTTKDALNTVTTETYDSLDRVISETVTPSGGTAHVVAKQTFDGEKKGQLSTATRYNGANYDQAVVTAVSGYNAANLPKTTTVTLPSALGTFAGSYTTTRYYTKNGLTYYQASPALGGLPAETLYSTFDAFDNPSSLVNQNDDVLAGSTTYTHLGQMADFEQFDPNYASPTLTTTGDSQTYFTWDATTGRLTNQWTTNRAKSITADLGKTTYTYTPSGKLSARATTYASRPGAPTDYQCYSYDYASRLAAVWTPSAKNCSTVPASTATTVAGLGGPAPYAQTYTYTAAGDRSQVKRFDAAGALAATEAYTYKAAGQPGAHQIQKIVSTPATGTATTSTFAWDATGQMTNRAGETLTYTPDGLLNTTSGKTTLPANPNPSATAGTPPGPAAGVAGSAGARYYDGFGNLVGITDGTGTTVTLGDTTAHNVKNTTTVTATCTYTFAGKTVAQRTSQGTAIKLAFVISDGVDTAQIILEPTSGTTAVTAITRYTDPYGLARGATQSAIGAAAYTTAPTAAKGVATNAANPAGYGAANGYIGGTSDTISALTHLGARDLDPITGAFTSPDPILAKNDASAFSAYAYSANDPINNSDPSGLRFTSSDGGGGGGGAMAAYPGYGGGYSLPTGGTGGLGWSITGLIGAIGIGHAIDQTRHNSVPSVQQQGTFTGNQFSSTTFSGNSALGPFQAHPNSGGMNPGSSVTTSPGWGPANGYAAASPQFGVTSFPAAAQSGSYNSGGFGDSVNTAALLASNAIMHAESEAATAKIGTENLAASSAVPQRWSVGSDINALTKAGNAPAWSTARGRFWKNESVSLQIDGWSPANIARMRRGLAPQRYNPDKGGIESMELSHEPIPQRDGGTKVVPRWPQDHAAIDPYRYVNY